MQLCLMSPVWQYFMFVMPLGLSLIFVMQHLLSVGSIPSAATLLWRCCTVLQRGAYSHRKWLSGNWTLLTAASQSQIVGINELFYQLWEFISAVFKCHRTDCCTCVILWASLTGCVMDWTLYLPVMAVKTRRYSITSVSVPLPQNQSHTIYTWLASKVTDINIEACKK